MVVFWVYGICVFGGELLSTAYMDGQKVFLLGILLCSIW